MGKLFWRIFLGLWLGSALLMAGTSVLIAMTVERRMPDGMKENIERLALAAARSALAVYETGSAHDAADLLDKIERGHSLRMYFIDEAGNEILKRKLPPGIVAKKFQEVASEKFLSETSPRDRGSHVLQTRITTESGNGYLAIIIFRRPPRPPPFFIMKGLVWRPMLASILLAGIISALVTHHLVNPISKLQSAARRLASGDLDYRIGNALRSRKDEFTALGKDFDSMADQIGQLLASQKLLMLDLSHELRSPLARIKVALELARRQTSPHALIDRMDQDADRMDVLIGELLLLAKLESPSIQQDVHRFDMSELVAAIVEDAQLEAASSGHIISPRIAPDLFITGNRELLRRAIENIVRNALRHTPDGSFIAVEALQEADTVRIVVADNGNGVAPGLIETLFTPFARGEDSRRDGNGLGLSITRAAVARHGGEIAMRTRQQKSGIEVTITLPVSDGHRGTGGE